MKKNRKEQEEADFHSEISVEDLLREQPELFEQLTHLLKEGESLVLKKKSKLIKMHSDNYMVIDTDILGEVKKSMTTKEYERFFNLGVFLKTKWNILFNHTRPFTTETLSKQLGINVDNTNRFVNKMVELGVLIYTVCAPSGYTQKIYSVNPQLIRRGNYYDKEWVLTYFKDFSKKKVEN